MNKAGTYMIKCMSKNSFVLYNIPKIIRQYTVVRSLNLLSRYTYFHQCFHQKKSRFSFPFSESEGTDPHSLSDDESAPPTPTTPGDPINDFMSEAERVSPTPFAGSTNPVYKPYPIISRTQTFNIQFPPRLSDIKKRL